MGTGGAKSALGAVPGPAVGAGASLGFPPDLCMVLESCTVRNPLTAHFPLVHPILLFSGDIVFDRKV